MRGTSGFPITLLLTCLRLSTSAPLVVVLPETIPAAKPIPFKLGPHMSPKGHNVSLDSISLWEDGQRWIPTSGEIHHARVPAAQWREELLKMKAGGLDTIGAYAFWIHYEEVEGQWNFKGRRDVRQFVQTAQDVGLKVLMRVGPWDHGETRNGGHPDWLLKRAKSEGFALRSNNPQYMGYVTKLYMQLATQLEGLWWHQGGPIFAMQVDNETPDWQYLLALKDVATKAGMQPAVFTKTGWPTPEKGYPSNYPMLPFFGGYTDNFWNSDMHEDPSKEDYFFGQGPSKGASQWTVPEGYPWLDIEIGGGMAAAYNHRPHMEPEDMPAAHMVFLANGVNGLGYYMYHGGNNPHSIFGDAPEAGLQESSFQPAGAQNPMNSLSYDFFAPLGEFGQARRHYHQMRRLHIFVRDFGHDLASMQLSMPEVCPSSLDDDTTLRWAVRSNGESGFLFINNYQRLVTLQSKTNIRFEVHLKNGQQLSIPHPSSKSLTINGGVWAHWPINLGRDNMTLKYATAQVLCRVQSGAEESTLVLAETEGVPVELAISGAEKVKHTSGTMVADKDVGVLISGLTVGKSAAVTATSSKGRVLRIIILPCAFADKAWKGNFAGKETLILSDAELVLHDGGNLHIRSSSTQGSTATVDMLPQPSQLSVAGMPLQGVAVGAFERYTVPLHYLQPLRVDIEKIKEAGPARDIPKAPSGKAEEPTAKDWKQTAIWTLRLNASGTTDVSQVRLGIRYRGDAARLYAGKVLLTDNWFTGYQGDGEMQVGLSYLAQEVPGLLSSGGNLTLHVLPLRKDSLETKVFVRKEFWPSFEGQSTVCAVDGVDVLQLGSVTASSSSLVV